MKATAKKYAITNSIGSNDPHNQFLDTLLRLGFVGLIVLLACFAWPAYWAYQNKDFFYLAFLAVFLMICLTETAFELQKGIVFFSLFNSLLIFHDAKSR
jgi:O-antigen ligase